MPRFSIITTCKGRLDHLRRTLPRMLAQQDAEVIVVDYSCPEGTGDYVASNFPDAQVVRIEGEPGFSNWKARNRGAEVASGDVLIFCDADTILSEEAVQILAEAVPAKAYGYFTRYATAHFNRTGLRLGNNQLRGFQVVPADQFRKLGGYDELLEGYAAGGDTDLEERLTLSGFKGIKLGNGIIDDVLEHDNRARFNFHKQPIQISYAAGLFYRRAKMALLRVRKPAQLTLEERQRLYQAGLQAARRMARGEDNPKMRVNIESQIVGMPRQLGYSEGTCTVSINVELSLKGKLQPAAPQAAPAPGAAPRRKAGVPRR